MTRRSFLGSRASHRLSQRLIRSTFSIRDDDSAEGFRFVRSFVRSYTVLARVLGVRLDSPGDNIFISRRPFLSARVHPDDN